MVQVGNTAWLCILYPSAFVKCLQLTQFLSSHMSLVNQCCLHTPYLTTTLLYLNRIQNLDEDLYFFTTHFILGSCHILVGREPCSRCPDNNTSVFLVSVHSAAIPPTSPTHTIHFPTSLQLFLSFLFSLTLPFTLC